MTFHYVLTYSPPSNSLLMLILVIVLVQKFRWIRAVSALVMYLYVCVHTYFYISVWPLADSRDGLAGVFRSQIIRLLHVRVGGG